MNKLRSCLLFASSLFSATIFATHHSYYDFARVKHIEPVYDYVRVSKPVRTCQKPTYRYSKHRHNNAMTATIVGAAVGGTIGNALGYRKSSKGLGTLVGAVIGGSIGHQIGHIRSHSSRQNYSAYHQPECRLIYNRDKERRLTGYRVTYRYQGETFESFVRQHPGNKIKIKINVSPAFQH